MENNNQKLHIAVVVIIIVLIGYFVFFKNKTTAPVVPDNNGEQIDRSQLIGNKEDLISFSIWPGSHVHGVVSYRGEIKGGYFFEGNIGINVLDANQKAIKQSNAMATTDWMTVEGVKFEGNIDFSGLPVGAAYFEIKQDDPSDGESGRPPRYVRIPISIDASAAQRNVYSNHGIVMDLPIGFTPHEEDAEGGPYTIITLPEANGALTYVKDLKWWEQYEAPHYTYAGSEKVGTVTFLKYKDTHAVIYYMYKTGNVGYMFAANSANKELLKTFKFVGWN